MASTVIYQKRGADKVKIMETPDLSPYALKTDVEAELAEKADIDGNYPDMTVGNAEQLVSEDYLTDTAPYVFRTAGGNVDIGDREYDELVGGTIAWNQFVTNGNFADTTAWYSGNGTFTVANNIATVTGTISTYLGFSHTLSPIPLVENHKYLITAVVSSSAGKVVILPFASYATGAQEFSGVTSPTRVAFVYISPQTGNAIIENRCFVTTSGTSETVTATFQNYMIFDLTAMFGTAIADYIYALEQATAGAGVAWFRTLFPKDYYAYNAGSLQSVQAASHDMVGFNQWDEEWLNGYYQANNGAFISSNDYICSKNKIQVFPNTTYYINTAGKAWEIYAYDVNGNYLRRTHQSITNATFTTGSDTYYINIGSHEIITTYNHDVCLNLSWSGYRNGEYEPYEKHSYPLDSTLTLRGIPKLDASNNLYFDGDTYASDGTVTRRYGIVDLGTLDNWIYAGSVGNSSRFQGTISGLKGSGNNGIAGNMVCTKYVTSTWTDVVQLNNQVGIAVLSSGDIIGVYDPNAGTDPAAFKSAMSGVYLVYELATPTTETADAFQTPQIVNDFGTEQYVDAAVAAGTRDVAIPVGHTTRYMSNLKDKLRRLPNIPDNAGTYLVYYDGATRRMSCTEYLDGAKVTALEGKVPNAPAEDGTYTLTATVADGEVTYSWVSA